jgi:hypothetical protein
MKSIIASMSALLLFLNINAVQAQNCIDSSLIDPNGICFDVYMPVCGCNGITYSNSCYAEILGGVIDFTPGPCAGDIIDAEPCSDLAGVDFGVCAMYMGITIINGACVGISGCGWVVNGVNYQTASYNSMEACQACLESIPIDAEPCTDVAAVDFGDCDMFMGIAVVNGQCTGISGCGFVVDDINYAPAFYSSMEDCEACLGNEPIDAEPCTDLANIDFGPCSMFIGYALNGGQCVPMSGCGTVSNNVNYQNALYATEAECELCLSSNGISEDDLNAVVLYPNPVQDMLHIVSKLEINRIVIYNSAGNAIFESNSIGQEFDFDTRNWNSGLYFVQIQTINGIITSKVLVH